MTPTVGGDGSESHLPVGRIFHVGWVVPDLTASMGHLGGALGLEWGRPARRVVSVTEHGDPTAERREREVVVTFSTTGPPYVELIETCVGSLWDAEGRARPHHVGLWVGDLAAASGELAQAGCPLLWRGTNPRTGLEYFAFHDSGHGLLIELLDSSIRQSWEEEWAQCSDRY